MEVVTGRDISTVIGAWEVRVSAGWPRSNRVSRDVLPEPLGPTRRTEGRVVAEADRYMTRWRKSGIDNTTNIVIRMAEGVGCSNEVSQL